MSTTSEQMSKRHRRHRRHNNRHHTPMYFKRKSYERVFLATLDIQEVQELEIAQKIFREGILHVEKELKNWVALQASGRAFENKNLKNKRSTISAGGEKKRLLEAMETPASIETQALPQPLLWSSTATNSCAPLVTSMTESATVEKGLIKESADVKSFIEVCNRITNREYSSNTLQLTDGKLTSECINLLVTALAKRRHSITEIDLSCNEIDNMGAIALAKWTHTLEVPLKRLNLSSNKINNDEATRHLAGAKVERLELSDNRIKGNMSDFMHTQYIRSLILSECGIDDTGAKFVLENDQLRIVDLSNNELTDGALEKFSSESGLIELNLNQNEITNKSVQVIARHKTLQKVNLGSNEIGDEAAADFAKSGTLKYLNLMQTDVTIKGFIMLCTSKSIEELRLFNNELSVEEVEDCHIDVINAPFVTLALGATQINDKHSELLKKLADVPTLRTLSLIDNQITTNGAELILSTTNKAVHIDLKDNLIDDATLSKRRLPK